MGSSINLHRANAKRSRTRLGRWTTSTWKRIHTELRRRNISFEIRSRSLPEWVNIRNPSTLSNFKTTLKSHLFTWLFSTLHQQLRSVTVPLNRFYVLWYHRNHRPIIMIILILTALLFGSCGRLSQITWNVSLSLAIDLGFGWSLW